MSMKTFEEKKEYLDIVETGVISARFALKCNCEDVDACVEAVRGYLTVRDCTYTEACSALGLPDEYVKGLLEAAKRRPQSAKWTAVFNPAKAIIKKKLGVDLRLEKCDSRDIKITEENIDSLIETAERNWNLVKNQVLYLEKRREVIEKGTSYDRHNNKAYRYLFGCDDW